MFLSLVSSQDKEKALVFRDITLKLPSSGKVPGKVLIENVTGKATAGRVLALMGPSGVCACAVCAERAP